MIEEEALNRLGLKNETVATQVVARDRHAVFFSTLAIIGGSLERLAGELRLLSHSGVKEVFEPFSKDQLGSSAMPHKKNPIQSENITGIARLLRASLWLLYKIRPCGMSVIFPIVQSKE